MGAEIAAIEYFLPTEILSTAALAELFPEWPAEQIAQKTGISERRIAAKNEFAIDLAHEAAQKLFSSGACEPSEVDMLLFCTETPEYLLPAGACRLQHRLGLSTSVGALDFNLGCSGYVYGLGIAYGLIVSGQATTVLLITADTLTKLLDVTDKSTRTIFGDGAAATLIRASDGSGFGPFLYGSDGSGAPSFMARFGGLRHLDDPACLVMDGPDLFSFAIKRVPPAVSDLLARARLSIEEIDLFVFHQANLHILEHLRRKLRISEDRFVIALQKVGNTAASSIPIALKEAASAGQLLPGALVMLVGFGAGLSWGATLIRWSPAFFQADARSLSKD